MDHLKLAGLIYGDVEHYLDHLAPLCAWIQVPLILTDEGLVDKAKAYYPGLEVVHLEPHIATETLVAHFDAILCCTPRDIFDEVFFFAQQLFQRQVPTIWCPHGNSDKGMHSFYMEALAKEQGALIYGKRMLEFLQVKNVFHQLKGHVMMGNIRRAYFNEHKTFYEHLAESHIGRKLPLAKRTFLYAPTWQDSENNSSFFDAIKPLIETLPDSNNLIVKLHPNLKRQKEFEVEEITDHYSSHPHVLFLENYPPIYSLLNLADVYIGDMSSIGYDFLSFNRPLFFLSPHEEKSSYLFRCGIVIEKKDFKNIHQQISHFFDFELRDFSTLRQEVYQLTFCHEKTKEQLKAEVEHLAKELTRQ
ncbi:MAG: hypothetical protein RLZZ453_813 [Chlamydiota bacterium]|jgi:hypothetical protein